MMAQRWPSAVLNHGLIVLPIVTKENQPRSEVKILMIVAVVIAEVIPKKFKHLTKTP